MPTYKYTTKKGTRWLYKFSYNNKAYLKRGFLRERDAKEAERIHKNKQASNGNSDIYLYDLFDEYIANHRLRMKEQTCRTAEADIRLYVKPNVPNKKTCDFTAHDYQQFQNKILKLDIGEVSKRRANIRLVAVFNYAVKFHGLNKSPAHNIQMIGTSSRSRIKRDIWTKEHFLYAYNLCYQDQDKMILSLVYWTGLRLGEMRGLKWMDVDFNNKLISIERSLSETGNITTTKTTGSVRKIYLHNALVNELKNWRIQNQFKKENDFVFFGGANIGYYILDRIYKKDEKKILPKIRFHDLRHSHASWMISENFDILQVSERLGHIDIKTTLQTYAHLYDSKKLDVASKINNILVSDH